MPLAEETEMTPEEIAQLLGRHETGVLALARSDEPYAIPISFGFDADEGGLYMRLVSTPESQKRQFLASNPSARLVVYEEEDAGSVYRSVVATGTLEEIPLSELTVETIEQYGEAKRPLFEIWGRSKADLEIQLYRLVPEELSGRVIEIDRDDGE